MLIKTAELTGAALDWAVAVAGGLKPVLTSGMWVDGLPAIFAAGDDDIWRPSIDWGQVGPLIDKYSIQVSAPFCGSPAHAYVETGTFGGSKVMSGKTTLEAICRTVVYHCIGEEVDIPDALLRD